MGDVAPWVQLVDTRPASTAGHLGSLDLTIANGYVVQSVQIGLPAPRVSAQPRTGGHGTDDETQWFGARAVQLTVKLYPEAVGISSERLARQIGGFLHPAVRPVMNYLLHPNDPASTKMRVRVRADSAPYTDQFTEPGWVELSIGFAVPDGRVETADAVVMSLPAVAGSPVAGRTYPWTSPRTYPSGVESGAGIAVNCDGDQEVDAIIRLYGPCQGPRIENVTSGAALVFDPSVTIAVGEFIECDTRFRTVRLNGDPTFNLYGKLAFASSSWEQMIVPGVQTMRFAPSVASSPAQAIVEFRPARMLV